MALLWKKPATDSRRFGERIEAQAAEFLTQHGLNLIDKNVTFRHGEIDLIMKQGALLVFVEIRYRKNQAFGGAVTSVDKRKQDKLIKAALAYLQQKKLLDRIDCRFDVVCASGDPDRPQFDWIENAFTL